MDVSSGGPWAGTGLDPLGARVLEFLVGHPSADAAAVAEAVGTSAGGAERALRALEDELLVIRIPGGSPRWKAGPPRSSLGSLLARRRSELARTELFMEQLDELYRSAAHPGAPDLVEVLEHADEVAARYAHLLKGSRSEVLHLAKPPYVTETADDSGHRDPDRTAVTPGVRLRSVYEADGFTDEVSLQTAIRGTAVGGEFRLGSRLPVKLALFDRTAALLPLHGDRPSAGSLVVYSPALIEVCVALFEGIWQRATPVSLESRQDWPAPRREREAVETDERTREILHLMATGMKDDAIARVLGVSRRTVQKHVSEAGTALGARTRFQIALLARERGWLDG
ncbi:MULTISPECIES: helix-turn-helix transcriptional regulator [unclassified Streptomyces]|uniref:helix-turn-helix transcriptional regulator n=1 Tax=unclassified Streptomyces TaxID=2593676 RepID=UPI0004763FBF|nr:MULTISPECIES: helix-turn-helix transcriptional regulator [unclassified Streptomyces]MYX39151.1 LuxR family transcriptional regulator [Streptomyces sp. SID8377]